MGGHLKGLEPELRSESLLTKLLLGQQMEILAHLESCKLDIKNPINDMGDTVGHYAAYKGYYKVLEYLHKKGDKFDIQNTRSLTAIDIALPDVREWMHNKNHV